MCLMPTSQPNQVKKDEVYFVPPMKFREANDPNKVSWVVEPVDRVEPTPINTRGLFHAVDKVDSLLPGLMQFSEEYIQALSHLTSPSGGHTTEFTSVLTTPPTTAGDVKRPPDKNSTNVDAVGSTVDPSMRIHPYQHERWLERYQDLVDFHRLNRHCNVPYVFKQNPCLGQWVKRQRHQYKLQKQAHHSNLTQERIQMLEMLGFIWDSHGAAWEENFQGLKEFQEKHGHCNVPCVFRGNSKLSTWIKRQRHQFRLFVSKKTSTMNKERISRLQELGIVWDYYGRKMCLTAQSC